MITALPILSRILARTRIAPAVIGEPSGAIERVAEISRTIDEELAAYREYQKAFRDSMSPELLAEQRRNDALWLRAKN